MASDQFGRRPSFETSRWMDGNFFSVSAADRMWHIAGETSMSTCHALNRAAIVTGARPQIGVGIFYGFPQSGSFSKRLSARPRPLSAFVRRQETDQVRVPRRATAIGGRQLLAKKRPLVTTRSGDTPDERSWRVGAPPSADRGAEKGRPDHRQPIRLRAWTRRCAGPGRRAARQRSPPPLVNRNHPMPSRPSGASL